MQDAKCAFRCGINEALDQKSPGPVIGVWSGVIGNILPWQWANQQNTKYRMQNIWTWR